MSIQEVLKRPVTGNVYPEHARRPVRIPAGCRPDGLPVMLYISGGSLGNVTLAHNGSFWAGVTEAGYSVKFVCATAPALSVSAEPGAEPTIDYPCKPVRSPSGWDIGKDGELGIVTE